MKKKEVTWNGFRNKDNLYAIKVKYRDYKAREMKSMNAESAGKI